MRAGIVTALIALCLPVSVYATSLRLSSDIDLLVLDGKKVSSSLLRGAESIELENGRHQLVFRVEKTIRLSSHEERLYISPPLVISFDTQLVSQVNFHLPRLGNERDAAHFDETPRVELLDGDAMPIPVKLDVMTITSTAKTVDYELEKDVQIQVYEVNETASCEVVTRKGETAFTVKAVREGNKLTLEASAENGGMTYLLRNIHEIADVTGGSIVKDTENGIIIVPEGCRQEIEL